MKKVIKEKEPELIENDKLLTVSKKEVSI